MRRCVVRVATVDEGGCVAAVLRDSITRLCADDHQNDPATLARWLHNKKPDNFRQWLQDPERYFVVAEADLRICGVGMLRRSGDLDLCYVLPGRERMGIGTALLRALEARARRWHLNRLQLISTAS